MDPLTQDQVAALDRAAGDLDHLIATEALVRQRQLVADWSIWEAHVIQGVPVRRLARTVSIGRGHVRHALGRVQRQLQEHLDDVAEGDAELFDDHTPVNDH